MAFNLVRRVLTLQVTLLLVCAQEYKTPNVTIQALKPYGVGAPINGICRLPSDRGSCRNELKRWFFNNGQCEQFTYGGCLGNENRFVTKGKCESTCLPTVSIAQWREEESAAYCKTLKYGCCSDGKTPAHGLDQKGCCMLTPFGCCPDNYKAARANLKGCECQDALHGCCPDNVTVSTGPNKKGCGCQYAKYGCCPDRNTNALGRNFAGCMCHTYQFGCCPDGVTVASGPNNMGCHCKDSAFGCCGDGQTQAKEPNQNDCDCTKSSNGCCLDGKGEAIGHSFQGCDDITQKNKGICRLPLDRGSCRNEIKMWFFNNGQCEQFTYGGCLGNENRFATKDKCEKTCLPTVSKDYCSLKLGTGLCRNYTMTWYFEAQYGRCEESGGCLDKENRYATKNECEDMCVHTVPKDQCQLNFDSGPCAGNYRRWGFNMNTSQCELFNWGGCQGNANRFMTEAACMHRCKPPGKPLPECSMPQIKGHCNKTEAMWSFSIQNNRCVPFYYSGCGGNGNRFQKLEDCQESCPSAYLPDTCTLPAEPGSCSNFRQRWYFDTNIQICRQFFYGGCDGNANNFETEKECSTQCKPVTYNLALHSTTRTSTLKPRVAVTTKIPLTTTTKLVPFISTSTVTPPASTTASKQTDSGKSEDLLKPTSIDQVGKCEPTATRVRGSRACSGQILFEDNFDSLREDLWQVEQYIPVDHPEYPFVSYQRPTPDQPTVSTTNGFLHIKPTLQQNLNEFNNESIYTGLLNLFSGCTAPAEACVLTASGANILPPVVSGRISSRSFAFTYGTVYVRAKLPQGDWLYPEILLEPVLKKYGSQSYASGVLKIATARGNKELYAGTSDHSNRIVQPCVVGDNIGILAVLRAHAHITHSVSVNVLYGGPIMDFDCRDQLIAKKVLFGGKQWGDEFHVYSMRWAPDHIALFVDGEEWSRVGPLPSGLAGWLPVGCQHVPRTLLASGSKLAPFDENFYITFGVAAGGVTEFPPGATTVLGHARPWTNTNPKAKLLFWQDMNAWIQTWTQPELIVDYVKVIAL